MGKCLDGKDVNHGKGTWVRVNREEAQVKGDLVPGSNNALRIDL